MDGSLRSPPERPVRHSILILRRIHGRPRGSARPGQPRRFGPRRRVGRRQWLATHDPMAASGRTITIPESWPWLPCPLPHGWSWPWPLALPGGTSTEPGHGGWSLPSATGCGGGVGSGGRGVGCAGRGVGSGRAVGSGAGALGRAISGGWDGTGSADALGTADAVGVAEGSALAGGSFEAGGAGGDWVGGVDSAGGAGDGLGDPAAVSIDGRGRPDGIPNAPTASANDARTRFRIPRTTTRRAR